MMLSGALLLAAGLVAGGEGRDLTLAVDGRSDYAIVLDDGAPNEVKYAARELQRFLREQTGARLPVLHEAGRAIRLTATDSGPHDWFRVRAAGGDLEVTGNARGVLYGAYEVLRRFGGCEWFSRRTSVIPKVPRFTVPAATDFTERAAFLLRETSWHDVAMDSAFGMRLRFNGPRVLGSDNREFPPVCRVHWPLGMCHTVTRLCPPKLYAKDHPEYYALRDGRRYVSDREQGMQLCLTNPEVLAIVTSNVLAAIRKSPEFDIYGVSQNDNVGYCQCERCAAVDAEEGSHAGTNIRFVNAVADAVAKEFPDKLVETLAYQYGRKVPQKTKPRDNVLVCLCSLELDFSRPILASGNPENVSFRDDIRDWRRIAKHMYVWDYTVNFNHYLAIHPNLEAIHGNAAFFRDAGVTHLFEQGNGQADGSWFAELKAWVIAQLLWNPDQPLAPLLDRFFRGYYGAAAPLVRRYYDEAAAFPRDEIAEKLGFNNKIIQPKSMPYAFLDRAAETLAAAAGRVKDDPVRRANVEELVYANDYMRAILTARSAGGVFLSRHPERLDRARIATAKPLAEKILARSSRKGTPGYVRLAEEETVVQPALADLRRLAAFEIPTGGVDRVRLEESELRVPESNRGALADDPAAENGRAIRLFGTCFDWTSGFDFAPCVFDEGARYRVRVRVRVDAVPGQSGEAFSFGIYNYAQRRRAFADRRVKTDEVKTAGYAWYELPAWKPEPGDRLWFASGEFRKGQPSAVRDVWIDAIEIVRAD